MSEGRAAYADCIITTEALFTANALRPEPGAVAIIGNEIVEVGPWDEVNRLAGPKTEVIDAGSHLVMPGFNDSHMHFALGSIQNDEDFCVDLLFTKSEQECAERVAAFAETHPDNPWIYGWGWTSSAWENLTDPTCASLDALNIERPICLSDFSMHVAWLNSAALKAIGVDADFPDPKGGVIRRDEDGNPTGVLCEPPATNLALDIVLDVPDLKASLRKTMARFASLGITAVSDMFPRGVTCDDVYGTYQEMADEGESTLRISFYPSMEDIDGALRERREHHGDAVRCAGTKLLMDGCVEAYTAFMHEPYLDAPNGQADYCGEFEHEQSELDELVIASDAAGFAPRIHAIGDATATMVIDAYQAAIEANGFKGTRFCIEHTDNLRFSDIVRMNHLGIAAAIQPQHPIGGFPLGMYEVALGEERTSHMWRYREEMDGGVRLGLGTDWPAVMSVDPLDTIYAVVTRSGFEGDPPEGFFRENALTLGEALQAHTVGSAYVEGFESRVGTLEAGKLADIVVLDGNPFTMDLMDLRSLNVALTMFDGRIVYRAEGQQAG